MVSERWELPREDYTDTAVVQETSAADHQMLPLPTQATTPKPLLMHLKCLVHITRKRCLITYITTRTPATVLMATAHMVVPGSNRLYVITKQGETLA
jgi:hypothetical protein